MRYTIRRVMGGETRQYYAQAGWLADAHDIVRALSIHSPVKYDILDSVTGRVYSHDFALRETA